MEIKKLDIKNIFIIILGFGLIISFFIGQKSNINYKKDELKSLHDLNELLSKKNDSLLTINSILDKKIALINVLIEQNNKKLSETQSQLDKLKKKRNEVSNHVNNLSADGVSNAFSDFLDKTTKGTNNNK
jgi:hypothetical protein